MRTFDCDALIIGSGFGGAVMAARLARKNHRVVVLERGRRWTADTYPHKSGDWFWNEKRPERQHGWFDFRFFPQMGVVQGAGVGGGSLVYANASVTAKEDTFKTGWPAEIRYQDLLPYYDKVRTMLHAEPLPATQATARGELLRLAADRLGFDKRVEELDLAVSYDPKWSYSLPDPHNPKHSKTFTNAFHREQGTCVHIGYCDIGCPVYAKNTLDLNYLAVAEDHQADVKPLHVARCITPLGPGFRVDYDEITSGALRTGHLTAERVIVCAGSLNSTALLLKCRDTYKTLPNLSSQLGQKWSSNGDFLTPSVHPWQSVNPTRGLTISTAVNFLEDQNAVNRFFIEDGGFPELTLRALTEWATRASDDADVEATKETARVLLKFDLLDRVMPWFAQGCDAGDGTLRLRNGELFLDWDPTNSESIIDAIVQMHVRMAIVTGGFPIVPPSWTLRKMLITPHPLGGARMGSSRYDGVVDHRGRVFGYNGLYVIDGSIIPRPLGLNPSKTIAALAERCADLFP